MKPTIKILLAISAILSINALAEYVNTAVNDAYADTAAAIKQPAAMVGKPANRTFQAPFAPRQGTMAGTPSGSNIKPMNQPLYGGYKSRHPKPATTLVHPSARSNYTGGNRGFDRTQTPQQTSTYPANVTSTSDMNYLK